MTCENCGGTMHGDGINTVIHCENTDADLWDVEPDAGPIYCDYQENPCKHENFREERIMDYSFLICNDCGHQWKA